MSNKGSNPSPNPSPNPSREASPLPSPHISSCSEADPFVNLNNDDGEGALVSNSALSKILQKSCMLKDEGGNISRMKNKHARKPSHARSRVSTAISARNDESGPEWDYEVRLPRCIGCMPDGDHYFEFGSSSQWMINVAVSEQHVGVFLHYRRPKLVSCRFKVGSFVGSLDEEGRQISSHPDEGWGVHVPYKQVLNVSKILLSPVDVMAERSRKAKAAMQFLFIGGMPEAPSSARGSLNSGNSQERPVVDTTQRISISVPLMSRQSSLSSANPNSRRRSKV